MLSRPPHHPNQHTPEEIKLILNMRKRNPNAVLIIFWVKLMQRGYTRSITSLYRFLRKQGIMAVKPANPKYVAKPYEQMQYPRQRIQIGVKFVPSVSLVKFPSIIWQYILCVIISSEMLLRMQDEKNTLLPFSPPAEH